MELFILFVCFGRSYTTVAQVVLDSVRKVASCLNKFYVHCLLKGFYCCEKMNQIKSTIVFDQRIICAIIPNKHWLHQIFQLQFIIGFSFEHMYVFYHTTYSVGCKLFILIVQGLNPTCDSVFKKSVYRSLHNTTLIQKRT